MRALRWTGRHAAAAVVGGLAGGLAAGLGARLVMWGVRVANPTFNGMVTHQGVVNGRWTWSGTWFIVGSATSAGVAGGIAYLLTRPLLRGAEALRGLQFGVVVIAVGGGSLVLDGSYEYIRFVPTWIALLAFASLYPLYGVVLGVVAGRLAPSPVVHHWPRLTAVGTGLLVVFVAVQLAGVVGELKETYFT